jgi:hypothetical protein
MVPWLAKIIIITLKKRYRNLPEPRDRAVWNGLGVGAAAAAGAGFEERDCEVVSENVAGFASKDVELGPNNLPPKGVGVERGVVLGDSRVLLPVWGADSCFGFTITDKISLFMAAVVFNKW